MSKEIRIGLLAIIAIVLLIWGYKYLLGSNILKQSNTYYVEYGNVDGLQVSDPVSISGYQVGIVKSITMEPNAMKSLMVELNLKNEIKLPANTVAELRSDGMMGGKNIILQYTGICTNDCIPNGGKLAGRELGLVASMVAPSELEDYMNTIKHGIGGVIDSVNASLVDGDPNSGLGKTMADLRITVANLKNSSILMNQLFAQSSGQLVGILENIESVTGTLSENNDQITGLLENTNRITKQLADARLDSTIFKANKALGSSGDAIASLKTTLDQAEQTFSQLQMLLKGINEGDGTLGKLAKDKELYDNLTATTKHMQLLLQDFRMQPKRYVNVSIFGKKHKDYKVPETDPALDTLR